MTLHVKIYPPIRESFEMARLEKDYKDRILELNGGEEVAYRNFLEYQKSVAFPFQNVYSDRWKRYSLVADAEIFCKLPLHDRQVIETKMWFEP